MKRIIGAATAAAVLSVVLIIAIGSSQSAGKSDVLPSFTLVNLQKASEERGAEAIERDETVSPVIVINFPDWKTIQSDSLFKGKVSIVNFWATWCPPCREEIPHFIKLQKKYGDKVQFVGLSVDRDGAAKVKQWVEENKVNYPVAVVTRDFTNPFQTLLPEGDRGAIPYTFVLAKDGTITNRLVGYRPLDFWEGEIKRLLATE